MRRVVTERFEVEIRTAEIWRDWADVSMFVLSWRS
jgi:hypothetical protein